MSKEEEQIPLPDEDHNRDQLPGYDAVPPQQGYHSNEYPPPQGQYPPPQGQYPPPHGYAQPPPPGQYPQAYPPMAYPPQNHAQYPTAYPPPNQGLPAYADASKVSAPEYPPDTKPGFPSDQKPSKAENPGEWPTAIEISQDEYRHPFEGGATSSLSMITGSNSVRCNICSKKLMYTSSSQKLLKCRTCQELTQRKNAKPMNKDYEFTRCSTCKGLFIVPNGTEKFWCPRDEKTCQSKKK